MKNKELRELTADELQQRHDNLWTELFGLRVKHALGQLENPLRLRALRRDIARTKTLLREQGVEERSLRRRQASAATKAASAAATGGKKKRGTATAKSAGATRAKKE
jgi:large subunit ribosomal protein L29